MTITRTAAFLLLASDDGGEHWSVDTTFLAGTPAGGFEVDGTRIFAAYSTTGEGIAYDFAGCAW